MPFRFLFCNSDIVFFTDILESGLIAYHYKDSITTSLETAASEDYRKIYKKLKENEKEWIYDCSRDVQIQSCFTEGKYCFFWSDYQYYYLTTNMIKKGMKPTMTKIQVNI